MDMNVSPQCREIVLLIFLVLVLNPVTVRSLQLSNEGRVRNYILNQANYSSRLRPVLNSEHTVVVSMSVQFFAMLELNERHQTITTAGWLRLSWNDELLTWNPDDFGGETTVTMYTDEIWTPKISLSVMLQSYSVDIVPHQGVINLQSNGRVNFGMPIVQTTQCTVTITSFPFDTQVCNFFVYVENQAQHKVSLIAKPQSETTPSTLYSTEWKFNKVSVFSYVYADPFFVDNQIVNLSAVILCIELERYPDYYIKTLIIPSTLLCFISFLPFLLHPESGERMSLGVSVVLGLTVFQILVAEILPESSEQRPIIDRYLNVTFTAACLAIPVSLINLNIAHGDTNISILKKKFPRYIFLELLPKLSLVSTYSERIRRMTTINVENVNLDHYLKETVIHRNDISTVQPTNEMQISPNSNEIEKTTQNTIGDIKITLSEKIKLESRIFALMMDRLAFACFLIFFIAVVCETIASYNTSTIMTYNTCDAWAAQEQVNQ